MMSYCLTALGSLRLQKLQHAGRMGCVTGARAHLRHSSLPPLQRQQLLLCQVLQQTQSLVRAYSVL